MRPSPCVISVGNFDGVHIGHTALIARAREIAQDHNTARVSILSFDPHPRSILTPRHAPAPLTTFARRTELLRQAGADSVRALEPTDQLLDLSPAAFIEQVAKTCNPVAFVEGPDFHFGKNRAGNIDTLRELGKERGFEVEVVPALATALSDHTVVTASSSITRWLIEHGRVRDAWNVLGRPHRLTGSVVRGERRGRTLGFPTANLETPDLLPADGVYAALARLPDGRCRAAALSVGRKPQFHTQTALHARTAEAYLLDATTEPGKSNILGLPEYGWSLDLDIVGWVRDQMRFDAVGRLVEQMHRDCARVREIIEVVTAASDATPADPESSPSQGTSTPADGIPT